MFFVFLSSPFPSHLGQISLAISELLRRGHKVEVWGDASLEQTANRLGAGFRLVPLPGALADQTTGYTPRPRDYYARFAFPLVAHQLPCLLELCDQHTPDLIHSNSHIYTAALASRITGIACSNHCCSGLSFGLVPEDLYGIRQTGAESQRKRDLMVTMNRAFHREMDSLFNRTVTEPLRLEPVHNILGLVSGSCVLALSCPELANLRLAALPQTVFTGPLLSSLIPPPGAGKEYCYVSLGTWPLDLEATVELYRAIIAGIPREYRVVVGLGGRFEPSHLGIDDDRVVIHKYAPQDLLISGANLVVCHGGCQTVHEALYFAKPLVMLPPNLTEPREMSDRVAGVGAGLVLDPHKSSSEDIRRAVVTLCSDDSFRQSAQRLGRSLRSAGGLQRAVESLERAAAMPAKRGRNRDARCPAHSEQE